MKRLKLAVIALFTLATISNVSAQDENNPWAVSFGVNLVDFYSPDPTFKNQLKDLLGNGDWNILPSISRISVEKYIDKGFSLQLAGSLNKIETVFAKNDSDFLYWAFDAVVKYDVNNIIGETGWFDPFVYAGGGYTSADSTGELLANVGLGFNTWFSDNLGFNFQTGTKVGFADKVRTHYQTSAGLVIKFGGKDTDGDGIYDKNDSCPEVPGLKEFNGCPDADGDGIKDSDDACPNVAGLASMNGCPDADGDEVADNDDMCPNKKGTKANKGCPDSDGDGVLDKDDKCANVAGPAANGGCPWPDTDGDGVLDKDDKCPNEAGVASNNGCKEDVMADKLAALAAYSKGILFKLDRANIINETADNIDKVYGVINTIDNVVFVLEGHADSTGPSDYNLYLSKRRAESVKDYLVKKGFSADRLETVGYGEKYPVASNNSPEERQKNRRVVIKINK